MGSLEAGVPRRGLATARLCPVTPSPPFLAAGAKLIPVSCACMVFGCFGSGVKTLNPVKQAASWVRGDSPAVLPRGSSAPAPGPASLLPSEAGRPGTLRARGVWRRGAVSSLGSGLSPPGLCFPRSRQTPRGRGGHLVSSSPRRFSVLAHAAPRPPLPSHSTSSLSGCGHFLSSVELAPPFSALSEVWRRPRWPRHAARPPLRHPAFFLFGGSLRFRPGHSVALSSACTKLTFRKCFLSTCVWGGATGGAGQRGGDADPGPPGARGVAGAGRGLSPLLGTE